MQRGGGGGGGGGAGFFGIQYLQLVLQVTIHFHIPEVDQSAKCFIQASKEIVSNTF